MTAFGREYGVCAEQRAEHSWVCFVGRVLETGETDNVQSWYSLISEFL